MPHIPSSIALFMAVVAAAANAQDRRAMRANAEGNQAYFAGNFSAALSKFEQALSAANDAGDKQYQAIAMYGLARTNAQACKLTEAERWFRESIALREALPDDRFARVTQNYLEYSRYLLAHRRESEAIPYMDKAIPNLERLGIESSDPIAFAEFLDVYAPVVRNAGRIVDAESATSRASDLRTRNPDKTATFKPERYPTNCMSSDTAK